jgi:hypothetical protein
MNPRKATLTIGGRPYRVAVDEQSAWVVPVDVEDHDGYLVTRSTGPNRLKGGPNSGHGCDCSDFLFRHAGKATEGCKHIQALAEHGLLPEDAEEAGRAFAEYFCENQAEGAWRGF